MKHFPTLYKKDIFLKVEELVSEIGDLYSIPVDIEKIVEAMGITIFPLEGLRDRIGVDATINGKLDRMYVDLAHYRDDKFYRRVRFSIAHELGHIILHKDFALSNPYNNLEEWEQFLLRESEKEYGLLEFHANTFAGAFLVPKKALIEAIKNHKNGFELARMFDVSEQVIEKRIQADDEITKVVYDINNP